jgi:hypothetical protein
VGDIAWIMITVQGNTDLFQIVDALRAPCRLSSALNRREQECNDNGDYRDNDEQLDKGKTIRRRRIENPYSRLTRLFFAGSLS